ncbi:GAF domain-containing protein [Geodermatophilus sp. SYSU D00684]
MNAEASSALWHETGRLGVPSPWAAPADGDVARPADGSLFRRLVDSVTDCAIVAVDARGRVASWNQGAAQSFGHRADEIIGEPIERLYPSAVAESGEPGRALAEAARRGSCTGIGWLRRGDGARFWGRTVLSASTDDAGHLEGFCLVVQDLTAQRSLEDKLHQRGRLEQRLLRALAEITQAVLEAGPSDEVLRRTARLARWLVGAAAATVVMPSPGGELVPRATDGPDGDAAQGAASSAVSSMAAEVMRSGRVCVVADPSPEPRAGAGPPAHDGAGSVLLVPLLVRKRVVGVVELVNRHGQVAFDDEQVLTVQLFAADAAVAVERVRMREHLRQLAVTPMLAERPLQETLDDLARSVVEFADAEACSVHLLDGDQRLRTVGSHGLPTALVLGLDAACRGGEHPAMEAITGHGPVVVEDARARLRGDERLRPVHDLLDEAAWTTVVCLPLIGPVATRGALCCFFAERPDDPDVAFLRVVASDAATIVGNLLLLAAARERGSLAERQHLARELHDSVSQALYGIALGARTIRELLDRDPGQISGPADYVLQLADVALAEMRALIFELRPESLELEGLHAALSKEADAVRARHGLVVETVLDDVPEVSLQAQHALYRIAQEALHNAARHGHAYHVGVRLHADGSTVILEVVDDGVGFEPDAEYPGHLGLRSMRERAAALGGTVRITSSFGAGTRVRVTVPSGPPPAAGPLRGVIWPG